MSDAISTENKIKEAARGIFLKKGYAGTKTRDIAEAAGINLALLNYYFRSKEKLFSQIMMESLSSFLQHILEIFMDRQTSLEEKLEKVAGQYIDQIKAQPDIPLFILSELRAHPIEFIAQLPISKVKVKDLVMFQQLEERIGESRLHEINPLHIVMNLMSMTIFPFVGRPMLETFGDMQEEQFGRLMDERKKLIPVWIMNMLN